MSDATELDKIALAAMTALVASPKTTLVDRHGFPSVQTQLAKASYEVAEAMIAEGKRRKGEGGNG
mgnify:CR=1 FL=1